MPTGNPGSGHQICKGEEKMEVEEKGKKTWFDRKEGLQQMANIKGTMNGIK